MVVEKILGQLKACKLVASGNSPHNSSFLEVGKVTVGRTPWKFRNHQLNLRDAYGATRRGQELDDRSATRRVTLIDSA